MIACGVFTGILFSRKPCGQAAAVHCGRCKSPLCKTHIRTQSSGPFLCPSCAAYEEDDDWNYSSEDRRWRHRSGSSSRDERVAERIPVPGDLSDEDKPGFATASAGGARGARPDTREDLADEGDDAREADDRDGGDDTNEDSEDNAFDAS